MILHIAFGKEMVYALWEDDFAKVIELSKNGDGDIGSIDTDKIDKNVLAVLLNLASSSEDWVYVTETQIEVIKKLEKNI